MGLNLVTLLMHQAGIAGLPGPATVRRIKGTPTADDLVERKFARDELDELWVSDIDHEALSNLAVVKDTATCSSQRVRWS